MNRRQFLTTSALASSALMMSGAISGTATPAAAKSLGTAKKYKTQIYKSLITKVPTDQICETWKKAGIDGMEVEVWNIPVAEARANRAIAEKHDINVHSVMRGWAQFNNKDKAVAQKTIDETKHAIRIAATYGAGTVLLVPCRVDFKKEEMPNPWDFDTDFDPKTLMVKSVVKGDNAPYADYIKAQNDSTVATIQAIEELIPVAAKEGVIVAVENVWNNLWCDPKHAAALVHYFDSIWLKTYFDLGNHTKYSKPQLWIQACGKNTIANLHTKGYKITEELGTKGGGIGDWCPLDQSTTDWKDVRKCLDDVGYNGWLSVEEGHYSPEKYSQLLDDFIAG